jgi:hypothetical protein
LSRRDLMTLLMIAGMMLAVGLITHLKLHH